MALTVNKPAAATLIAAAFSMLATPVSAVELPRASGVQVFDAEAMNAERNRRWRDRDRVDAGDVIAGVLILGGIAAIAGAASRNRERERAMPYPVREPRGVAGYDSRTQSRGIDRAVDICVAELERGRERVGSVESAARTGEGWHVAGELDGGETYACWIGNDGRVSEVRIDGDLGASGYGTAPAARADDGQYDDDYYSRARESLSGPPPLPERYEDYEEGDGRYETARAPDFE